MKKSVKIVAGIVVALIVVAFVTVTLFLNGIVRTAVETGAPKLMGVSVELEDIDLRVLRGKFKLSNLVIGNPEGFKSDHMFKLGDFTANVNMKSLFTDTIVIREIVIDAPEITYEIGLTGSNVGKLIDSMEPESGDQPKEEKPEKEEKEAAPAKKVIIESLVIRNGKVGIAAKMLGGHGAAIPLPTIHLTDIGKEEEGASPAVVVADVLGVVVRTVIGTVSKSGQLVGKGAKATAEAALKGALVSGDLTGKGVGAAVDVAGKGLGAAAGGAAKAGETIGKGVGAAAGTAGKAGKAVGRGAAKVAGGLTGLFKRDAAKEDEAEEETADE